jgi:hypothetical protein
MVRPCSLPSSTLPARDWPVCSSLLRLPQSDDEAALALGEDVDGDLFQGDEGGGSATAAGGQVCTLPAPVIDRI